MKKITASILSVLMMLSMVFSSSVFAANEQPSAWESFVGLFSKQATTATTGVEYRGHIQNKGDYPLDGTWIQGPNVLGTTGESLRLEGFWIRLTNKPANVNIQYRVHVQNVGWMAPVQNGNFAGTEGKAQRIEAIEISLVDDKGAKVTGYSVQYKGHIQYQGDTEWLADGAQLGTTGLNRRLEALEVKIVKTEADMTAYDAAVAQAATAKEEDYTTASYAALTKAVADNVVTKDNTQAEVDAATKAINDAFAALVPGADLTAYNAAVEKAEAVDADLFTTVSYEALTKALADNVVTKDNTADEVAAATAAIEAAIEALVPVADMEAYDAAVAKAEAVVEADYTAATYAALQTALEENVVTNQDSQEDVDAATAAINAAYDALVKILKVESVSAINGKQVTVTFNQDVTGLTLAKSNFTVTQEGDASGKDRLTDSASATNGIAGATVNTGVISAGEDANAVVLTIDNGISFTNSKKITVLATGIVYGDNTMADVTKTSVLSDKTAPSVLSAKSIGSNQFMVVFSEPVYNGTTDAYDTNIFTVNNIMVNNGGVAISAVARTSANPNALVVTTGASLVTGTEYTVKVNNSGTAIRDFVGYNVITDSTVSFTHTIVSDVPSVTAEAINDSTVRLTFDREVIIPNSANIEFRYAYNATGANKIAANTLASVSGRVTAVSNSNKMQYDIKTFTPAMSPGNGQMFVNYTVVADAGKTNVIKDLYGNVLPDDTMVSFTVVDDTTAPTAKVEYYSATKIDVTFDTAVTGATTLTNYGLKDPKGNNVAITGAAVQGPAEDNKYRLTVADMSEGGNFVLSVGDGIKDNSVNQNKFVPQSFTIAVPDTKAPTVNTTSGVVSNNGTIANADVLYVYASEMMGTSATDAANYRLVSGTTQYVLPTNTTITQTGTTIKIALPKTLSAIAADLGSGALNYLYIGGIKDLAGNTVNPMGNRTINVNGNFNVDVTKIKIKSDSQIEFTVDRQLKAVDATKIVNTADVSKKAQSASFVNNADGTATITANFDTVTPVWGTTASGAIDVQALALTDLNDIQNNAATNKTISIDRAAPKYVSAKTVGTGGYITGIEMTYSENIYPASVDQSDYTVEGYTVTGVAVDTSSHVTVQVAKSSSVDSGSTPKITQVGTIEDLISITADTPTRNQLVGPLSQVTPTAGVSPALVSASTVATSASKALLAATKEFTVTATSGGVYDGAYGNAIKVEIVGADSGASGGALVTSATYASGKLTITLDTNAGALAGTLQDILDAVNAVDGFSAAVSGSGVGTTAIASSDTVVAVNLAGGKDVVTSTFSSTLNTTTVDTADVNSDFVVGTATVTGTQTATGNTVTSTITASDKLVKGQVLNAIAGAIADTVGNTTVASDTATIN